MSKYDGATIEVINWEKYNPRTDSRKPTWFRFENCIATGSSFFGLDCEQKWLWVFILSLISQAGGEKITWNSAYTQHLTGITPEKQEKTIDIFVKFVRLRVSRKVTSSSTGGTRPLRTNERTNETYETRRDGTNETTLAQHAVERVGFDFDQLYENYPKHVGRKKGIARCKTQIRTQEKYDALARAVKNYRELTQGKDPQYVKQFDTFMNCWEDYVDLPAEVLPLEARKRIVGEQISREEQKLRESFGYA